MDLLGSGREADVYALDEHRVLRRYRRGDDGSGEAEVMDYLAGHGFPVPRVYSVDGPDMIMERLDGRTMPEAFLAGAITVSEGAAILADLHHRLHELPARLSTAPGDRVLHRDLHPENVMLTSRGPVLIDWHNAAEGPAAVDVCLTAIILAQAAADRTHPQASAAAEVLAGFLARTGDGALSALGDAIAVRRADPALSPDEAAQLADTVTPLIRAAWPSGDLT
ncbi:phosphotransferase [Actinoplanes sp. NPDC049802]|uniref:phosphotransferase n=1 Tax=Actinoplanes sp. NPDC049802 TaxID=3154742 RepID=UPI0034039980